MSEIVERLLQSIQVGETKEGGAVWRDPTDIEIEAAAEIERLEAEVSRLTNLAQEGSEAMPTWEQFIETYKPDQGRKPKISNIYIGEDEYNAIRNAIRALIPQEHGEKVG